MGLGIAFLGGLAVAVNGEVEVARRAVPFLEEAAQGTKRAGASLIGGFEKPVERLASVRLDPGTAGQINLP